MKKILILASNPKLDLRLDREVRSLIEAVDRSQHRDQLDIKVELAVRLSDLQPALLKFEPDIVHFCGHGTDAGIVLENEAGQERVVSTEALSNLFALLTQSVECVLLNACYSEQQADAIVQHISFVIGMSQEIRDDAAIAFSRGFYGALGAGRSIEQSYQFGCNAIQIMLSSSPTARSTEAIRKLDLIDEVQPVSLPEHLKPILKRKPQLNPSPVTADRPPQPSPMKEFIVEEIKLFEKDIATAERREAYLAEELAAIAEDIALSDSENAKRRHRLRQKKVEEDQEEARARLKQLRIKLAELRSQL